MITSVVIFLLLYTRIRLCINKVAYSEYGLTTVNSIILRHRYETGIRNSPMTVSVVESDKTTSSTVISTKIDPTEDNGMSIRSSEAASESAKVVSSVDSSFEPNKVEKKDGSVLKEDPALVAITKVNDTISESDLQKWMKIGFGNQFNTVVNPRERCLFRYRKSIPSALYLIVVNYHWKKYSSLSFFRGTFFPRFAQLFNASFDVVYVGPEPDAQVRVIGNGLRQGGIYSYYSLNVACGLYASFDAEYAGYFLMNDDSILDPLHLNHYDLRHSWSEPTRVYDRRVAWSWRTYPNELGVNNDQAFSQAINDIVASKYNAICHLDQSKNVRRGLSDFFYVTHGDLTLYLALSEVFYQRRVFLEMAVPSFMWCITKRPIITCNHHFWPKVESCVFLHPMKFGNTYIRKMAMNHINRIEMKAVAPMGW